MTTHPQQPRAAPPRTFGYYRTRADANEDAKYLRSQGIKCRVENSTGTRARRATYEAPWKIVLVERETP